MRILSLLWMLPLSVSALAADNLIRIDSAPNVQVPVFSMKRDGATATVILLPGGGGGLGRIVDGKPSSQNFLVRSRDHFAAAGLNVAIMGRASDRNDLDYADRITPDHIRDIKAVVDHVKKETGLPVWLVGTSRGTVSATAAAIALGRENLAGIVLTSSVVNHNKTGAVPTQALDKIAVPVLVVHHEQDACRVCAPHAVPAILRGLKNAPASRLLWLRGGDNRPRRSVRGAASPRRYRHGKAHRGPDHRVAEESVFLGRRR